GFEKIIAKWADGELDICVESVESPNEVKIRLQQVLEDILRDQDVDTLLICMHGRAMRMFLCLILNLPFSEMDKFPHQNTALYKLDCEESVFALTEFCNTDHLHGLDC